jgi:hypothetical protein
MCHKIKFILLPLVFAICAKASTYAQPKISLGDESLGVVLECVGPATDSVQLRIWNKSRNILRLVSPSLLNIFYQAYQNPTDSLFNLNFVLQFGLDTQEFKGLDSVPIVDLAPNQVLKMTIYLARVRDAMSLPSNRNIQIAIAYQPSDSTQTTKIVRLADFYARCEMLNVMFREDISTPSNEFFKKQEYLGFAKKSICTWATFHAKL